MVYACKVNYVITLPLLRGDETKLKCRARCIVSPVDCLSLSRTRPRTQTWQHWRQLATTFYFKPVLFIGNCLENSNGIQFTTHDRDNDEDANVNCAHGSVSGFGWWFRSCTSCQLNGSPQSGIAAGKQLKYSTWANQATLQHAKMKVRDRKSKSYTVTL